jgi:hypothetical protein
MLIPDETENAALRLLPEIRAEQDAVVAEIREANGKLDAFIAAADMKHHRRVIELSAIRGCVRRVEETRHSSPRRRLLSSGHPYIFNLWLMNPPT